MQFFPLEKLVRMHDGYRQVFVVNGLQLLLIQENGHRYIFAANCPHSDWPMQNAHITSTDIICPKHGWSFDLKTGLGSNEMALACQINKYKIMYEGSTLGVLLY